MKFQIESEIFEKFPGVRVGVLVVLRMDNTKGKKEIAQLLAVEEEKKQKGLAGIDLKTHLKIAPWREIYQKFGSKPSKYSSSVEALLKRVVAGSKLPNINPLVDLYNFISIKHFVPVGAEDLDKVKGDIVFGFAKGDEKGKYIGSDEISTCYPGEVVYKDDLGFICRRWNWREADRTKLTPESKNAVVVIEAAPSVTGKEFQVALNETANLIKKYLKGKIEAHVLDVEKKEFDIGFEPGKKLTKEELIEPGEVKKAVFKKEVERPEEFVRQKLFKIDKASISYKLRQLIYEAAVEVVGKRAVKLEDIQLEHPAAPEHGDYASNVAMALFGRLAKKHFRGGGAPEFDSGRHLGGERASTPFDLANVIVNAWRSQGLPEEIAKIEVAKPGFINLWLKNEFFISQIEQVLKEKDRFGKPSDSEGKLTVLKGKKILLEHTSPNPQTTIMLGHLRNNFLGMTMAQVLEFLGAKVTKDCIVNDRGIHICRSVWGYLVFGQKGQGLRKNQLLNFRKVSDAQIRKAIKAPTGVTPVQGSPLQNGWRGLLQRWAKKKSAWWQPKELGLKHDHANLIWYVLGSRAYALSEKVQEQVKEILIAWEAEEKGVWEIWRRILDWSDKGYQETYARVSSVHDYTWYESKLYKEGKELVKKGLKKGVFRESEGAIVSDLAKYGLPDAILIKSDGTALYHTFDFNLTLQKRKRFPSDLYIWDIGNEQILYLKQLFVMCEQLGIGRREDYFHLNYALMNFKGGKKMTTRRGDVVMADEVLNELQRRALMIIKESNQELRGKLNRPQLNKLAETVAISAIKYSLLKFSRETTIQFDIDESLALEGNSGPYLQYTYARCQSVLKKANQESTSDGGPKGLLRGGGIGELSGSPGVSIEEIAILRTLYKFPEVVLEAGENFAPNLICNFLFDLAQKYNQFYNKQPILQAESEELRTFRLALTTTTTQLLKNGLNLLGIDTPERM